MYIHDTHIRVRYAETDQMGIVYYGKYAEYFEVGRAECIRSLGISYKAVEEQGIQMPVVDLQIKYLRPAYYDDLIKVRTIIPEFPRSAFLTQYEIYNEADELLVSGKVKLAFFDMQRKRPVRLPDFIKTAIEENWNA